MSIVRRSGAEFLRLIAQTLDPSVATGRIEVYAKLVSGIAQLFARTSDGVVYQLTPAGAGAYGGDPADRTVLFDDFIGIGFSTIAVSGAGSNSLGMAMGAGNPGTYTQVVTAAGVDAARITFGGNSFFFGGGRVEFETLHRIPVLSDNTNNIVVRDGFNDSVSVADAVDGFYTEYDLAVHGSQNYFLCAALNSVRQKVDTGIAAVAGVNRKIKLTMNAAGTLGTCTIDGVPSANSVNTNIPNSSTRATHIQLQAVKQLGVGALTVLRDYWRFEQILTTPR